MTLIQLTKGLLTRANVHPQAFLLLAAFLSQIIESTKEEGNYLDTLLDEIKPLNNYDARAELMQALFNNDKLNKTALALFASILSFGRFQEAVPVEMYNNTIWRDYLNKIGIGELYELKSDVTPS